MNIKLSSLNKGLVAHWTMSQDSLKGSLLADKTPYSNDGTIYGATFTTDRMGQANKAMSFDGVDNYIDCGNNSSLNITKNITISLWVNLLGNGYGVTPGIISRRNDGFGLIWTDNNETQISSRLYQLDGTAINLNVFAITKEVWHNIVLVANSSNNIVKIYMDSIQQGLPSNYDGTIRTGSSLLYIGQQSSQYLNGSIDDVRIYNRALSEEEIKTLYNSYNPNIKIKTSLPKIKLYGGDNTIKSEGYIRVDKNKNNAEYFDNPLSNLYGKQYFYVMQWQARNVGGVPTSTGTGLPWVNINQNDAKAVSEAAGYHLITNWEWMAIARDIEQVAENWTGGVVGSGILKRGNVGITDAGSYDGGAVEAGILNDKAKLKLSNGEEIYHFSGNVWEWNSDTCSQTNWYNSGAWIEWNNSNLSDYEKPNAGPSGNYTSTDGAGRYYGCTANGNGFRRGGTWNDGANAGVFALLLNAWPTVTHTALGFRCAR